MNCSMDRRTVWRRTRNPIANQEVASPRQDQDKKYFLVGADREDILQEGAIGLYKAILDFRREKLSTFRTFAEICIKRQVIMTIKAAVRQKHVLLNSYISYDTPVPGGDSDQTLLDVISAVRVTDPEELAIKRGVSRAIRERILKNLSTLEYRVLVATWRGSPARDSHRTPPPCEGR